MKMTFENVVLVLAFLLVMVMLATTAHSKTVNVCVSITLPAKGKCIYKTVKGYKLRVCNP